MLLNDREIKRLANLGMIEPFVDHLVREEDGKKVISYGLSSSGYDIRLADHDFRVFKKGLEGDLIDPKNFSESHLEKAKLHSDEFGDYFIIPGGSYGLGVSLEKIKMPRDVMALCYGKSTYARCFSGDTKVSLIDGDYTFLELIERFNSGDRLYGWGVDEKNNIVCQELFHPRYIENSALIEVILDDDSSIKCTPDHIFLMRDGTLKQAKDLNDGDSLRAIYFGEDDGYQRIWDGVNRKFFYAHRAVLGFPSTDLVVHHKDGNRKNNRPENLEIMSRRDHAIHHYENDLISPSVKGGMKIKKMFDAGEFYPHWLNNEENKEKAALGRSKYNHSEENKEKLKKANKKRWECGDSRKKQSSVALNGVAFWNKRHDITEITLTEALLKAGSIRGAAKILNVDKSAFRRFPDIIKKFKNGELLINHKIKTIRYLKGEYSTYCLTAENGNFALSNGVFVKNCSIMANVTPLEIGWQGHITLEFSNDSPTDAKIYANEGVIQLVFLRCDEPMVSYEDRRGKYQDQGKQVVLARV